MAVCKEYGVGTKAYYDAFMHIVACTVLEVIEPGNGINVGSGKLRIRCDENKGPYKKGETMEVSGYHTFPKKHRYATSNGQYRIEKFYQWVKS
jgi:hypothetical protein